MNATNSTIGGLGWWFGNLRVHLRKNPFYEPPINKPLADELREKITN